MANMSAHGSNRCSFNSLHASGCWAADAPVPALFAGHQEARRGKGTHVQPRVDLLQVGHDARPKPFEGGLDHLRPPWAADESALHHGVEPAAAPFHGAAVDVPQVVLEPDALPMQGHVLQRAMHHPLAVRPEEDGRAEVGDYVAEATGLQRLPKQVLWQEVGDL